MPYAAAPSYLAVSTRRARGAIGSAARGYRGCLAAGAFPCVGALFQLGEEALSVNGGCMTGDADRVGVRGWIAVPVESLFAAFPRKARPRRANPVRGGRRSHSTIPARGLGADRPPERPDLRPAPACCHGDSAAGSAMRSGERSIWMPAFRAADVRSSRAVSFVLLL